MAVEKKEISTQGLKFFIKIDGQEVARAFLYLLKNDLHDTPFGFLEDIFVNESHRGQGYSKILVQEVINEARVRGCYKLICTSRYGREQLHEYYQKLGFKDHGKEFRIDFEKKTSWQKET